MEIETTRAGRELIHQINNLLAVIQTQIEVARALQTPEAANAALESIDKAAQSTQRRVQALRSGKP